MAWSARAVSHFVETNLGGRLRQDSGHLDSQILCPLKYIHVYIISISLNREGNHLIGLANGTARHSFHVPSNEGKQETGVSTA